MSISESSKISESGLPSKFLTADELYEFRFLTTFLSFTNHINDTDTRDACCKSQKKRNSGETLQYYLSRLTQILIRDTEKVPLTASGLRNIKTTTTGIELEPLRVFVVYTDKSEEGQQVNKGSDGGQVDKGQYPPLDLGSVSTVASEDLLKNVSVTSWYWNRTVCIQPRYNEHSRHTDIRFGEHCGNVIHLLKETHAATDEDARSRAHRRFSDYIILSSCAKVYKRIQRGTTDLPFFKNVSVPGEKLAAHIRFPQQQRLKYLLRLECTDHALRPFTPQERHAALQTIRALRESAERKPRAVWKRERKAQEQGLIKNLVQFEEDLVAKNKDVHYDISTLPHIQTLICAVLGKVRESTEDLMHVKTQTHVHKLAGYAECKAGMANFGKLVGKAGFWLQMLYRLTQRLRVFVKATLICMRVVYRLDETLHDYKKQSKTSHEESIDTEGSWDAAALEWLDSLCLQFSSYAILSSKLEPRTFDKHVGQIIMRASFQLVRQVTNYKDNQLLVDKYLRPSTLPILGTSPSECEIILNWLEKHSDGANKTVMDRLLDPNSEMSNFNRAYHPTMLLTSLILLGKNREALINRNTNAADPSPQDPHLQIPPEKFTAPFHHEAKRRSHGREPNPILSTPQTCCPACHILSAHLKHPRIKVPPNPLDWVPTSLAPWIPKTEGLVVLEAARKELQARFQRILGKAGDEKTMEKGA